MPTVKTAISVEQDLLVKVGDLASTLNVSRSRVFAMAAEDLLRRQSNKERLCCINTVSLEPCRERHG